LGPWRGWQRLVRILTMRTVAFTEGKAHLSELVDRVHREHDRVTITRNGRPVAVLIAPDDLESLEETVALLSDPEALAELREAQADFAAGRAEALTYDEAKLRFLPTAR
jgi:antitoxin YefM